MSPCTINKQKKRKNKKKINVKREVKSGRINRKRLRTFIVKVLCANI